ncbi:hypothetical protein [Lentzea sp. HUAS12]|uniref:hypothetical protein n=1 Tax=Lentzea sp. HUAS12 TaxID=2951806 RepID=UPI0020A0EBBA|nr:hypothetical protein [Lentzea sp. HUAS12]USX55244.1 hypothetical protein ND450_14415 [Lentzea sp. HUAS12]
MSFDRIRALIESRQVLALGEVLKSLTPQERAERAKDLVAYEKQLRAAGRNWEHPTAMAITGAGLLPGAATLTPWLVRYRIWYHRLVPDDGIGVLLDVLRHRDVPWKADLVTRLASRMPVRDLDRHDLYSVIVELCGENPPDSDGFLLHLLAFDGHERWRPGFDVLLPRLLEVPGAGAHFGRSVREFLCARTDRRMLLDGCLARLQQGGAQADVKGFLDLHAAIGVTPEEATEHVRDYVAMLPDSRSTVVALAQERLRSVDEAGELDFDLVAEASRSVFGRTEKKLIRAQLAWLARHAQEKPDEVVLTVAELFAHESDDLRGQAVELIAVHQAGIGADTRSELRALAAQLPADLAARLGVETTAADIPGLAGFTPSPWPDPIATLDELTAEVGGLLTRTASHIEPVAAERVLEALVRFAWQDREALVRAFAPLREKNPWIRTRVDAEAFLERSWPNCRSVFTTVVTAAADVVQPVGHPEPVLDAENLGRNEPGCPGQRLAGRLREIARDLLRAPRPALVSTPTETSGLLDAATLLERLAKAEAGDWDPGPRDLRQAYHRLPRDTRPEDFASLTSTAGQVLRAWLAEPTEPVVELVERRRTDPYVLPRKEEVRLLVTVEPGLPEPEEEWFGHSDWESLLDWWPLVLPARREVVAAHLVPHLAHRRGSSGNDGAVLPGIARAHGPIGVATTLALAYGLGTESVVGRAQAVDAVLVLAARGQFDGRALGEVVGRLLEHGGLAPNRIVPCLRDIARSGAAAQVWDVVAAVLPKAWSHTRVADLVELAVELAQQLRPGGTVEGLGEVAARKGASKAVVQAKRLLSALS